MISDCQIFNDHNFGACTHIHISQCINYRMCPVKCDVYFCVTVSLHTCFKYYVSLSAALSCDNYF